jgi:hypothetical protein
VSTVAASPVEESGCKARAGIGSVPGSTRALLISPPRSLDRNGSYLRESPAAEAGAVCSLAKKNFEEGIFFCLTLRAVDRIASQFEITPVTANRKKKG